MSFRSFCGTAIAGGMMLAAVTSAFAADYRDPKHVFSLAYDDSIWSLDIDESGDFGVECRPGACQGAVAGCSLSKERVMFGSVARIMKSFDGESVAREQLLGFAEQKAELEQTVADNVSWDRSADVNPSLVQPYEARQVGGHPMMQAEFRMSMAGATARYVSYMTAAGSYSVAVVCHATEAHIDVWRPRFEALMATFRPTPQAKSAR